MATSLFLKLSSVSLIIASAFISLASASSNAISLQWSNTSYGPDGPWQAVSIGLGTPTQKIDLFPGGSWTANILSTSVCPYSAGCSSSNTSLFNRIASTSYIQINNTGTIINTTFASQAGVLPMLSGNAHIGLDTLTISAGTDSEYINNFELLVIDNADQALSNGTEYTPQIGTLALGAPGLNQTFSSNLTGHFLSSGLNSKGKIPSNSFGLHIGSASMDIPGSLVLGGYDHSRVLAPITIQRSSNGTFPMSLVDISIGTADGFSPFNINATKSGLLFNNATTTASRGSLDVNIDPSVPYLYLPSSTCNTIASSLPVIYNENTNLYLWNTTSPLYKPIISSPTYVAFTFSNLEPINQNTQISIKVPFSLLSLSLTSPLSNTSDPLPYFPCQPSFLPTGSWALGRAFLQAAFLGTIWSNSPNTTASSSNPPFFLAQAPGPGFSDENVINLSPDSTSLNVSSTRWKDTWSSHWTPLTDPISLPLSSSSPYTTQLSRAKIIGIAIGSAAFFIFLLAAFFWVNKRKANVARLKKAIEEAIEKERQGTDSGWIKLENDH